jgi:hypothetical protein
MFVVGFDEGINVLLELMCCLSCLTEVNDAPVSAEWATSKSKGRRESWALSERTAFLDRLAAVAEAA